MRRIEVPTTKSNLLRLKEHFGFIKSGHEVLDQKRQILLEELIEVFRQAGQLRRDVEAMLQNLYGALRAAELAGGRAALEAEALAAPEAHRLVLRERSAMGVIVPRLELQVAAGPEPVAAPGWASAAAARVRRLVRESLPLLVRLAEIEVSCLRLAAELQKTKRKVNALENIFIPEYRETIHFIEGSLEEKEREALFQMKRFKGRQTTVRGR
jgi:V/A-type H+/Na+-transporting ATPase subunit D